MFSFRLQEKANAHAQSVQDSYAIKNKIETIELPALLEYECEICGFEGRLTLHATANHKCNQKGVKNHG